MRLRVLNTKTELNQIRVCALQNKLYNNNDKQDFFLSHHNILKKFYNSSKKTFMTLSWTKNAYFKLL